MNVGIHTQKYILSTMKALSKQIVDLKNLLIANRNKCFTYFAGTKLFSSDYVEDGEITKDLPVILTIDEWFANRT